MEINTILIIAGVVIVLGILVYTRTKHKKSMIKDPTVMYLSNILITIYNNKVNYTDDYYKKYISFGNDVVITLGKRSIAITESRHEMFCLLYNNTALHTTLKLIDGKLVEITGVNDSVFNKEIHTLVHNMVERTL